MAMIFQLARNPSSTLTTTMFLKDDSYQWSKFSILLFENCRFIISPEEVPPGIEVPRPAVPAGGAGLALGLLQFNSCLESVPVGVSTNDLPEALQSLLGKDAKGFSPTTITRLKSVWEEEYDEWSKRSLKDKRYVYMWADLPLSRQGAK